MSRTVYYNHSGNEVDPPKADTVRPSNADRIRGMSDEELAEVLHNAGGNWYSEEYWLNWLKQNAKEDE